MYAFEDPGQFLSGYADRLKDSDPLEIAKVRTSSYPHFSTISFNRRMFFAGTAGAMEHAVLRMNPS